MLLLKDTTSTKRLGTTWKEHEKNTNQSIKQSADKLCVLPASHKLIKKNAFNSSRNK